ncbi:MAG: MFS transporter [Planctomycetes bacterium]|nr:MFS transporter [Planctomycetota bacterium]
MRSLKAQYFFAFAVIGSIMPFLPVYLAHLGFSKTQIGYINSVGAIAVVVTPAVLALLADVHFQTRRLLCFAFLAGGAAFAAMLPATAFWPVLILYGIHCLAFVPALPLQDSLTFHSLHAHAGAGRSHPPYHRIRVWGSLGFMLPSLLIFFALWFSASQRLILIAAIGFCMLGAINSFMLPAVERDPGEPRAGLPTVAAIKTLAEPHMTVFCLALLLMYMSSSVFYGFYPLHLTERVGLDGKWVGLIANIGVFVEVFFMLGFGWIERRIGVKLVLALGIAAWIVRFLLLAASPSLAVALATQVLHGPIVLVLHVAPPVYLNRSASPANRASVQAVYGMLVGGIGRIVGAAIAGHVASIGLPTAFAYAAGLNVLALVLLAFAFHDKQTHPRR